MVSTPLSNSLVDQKRKLRREMAERRAGLPQAEREACARAVASRLLALPGVEAARARGGAPWLSGYVAFRGELDPAGAMQAARDAGFRLALPRIETVKPPRLCFHEVRGPQLAAELAAGPHGLSEPMASCPDVAVDALDVMLVPGLAFDAAGRRLGHGGGYYDDTGRRLRAGRPDALMIGLCYDFQVVDACPADERDVPVDLVVTERRVLGGAARA
jgi:5-formyltetrahydrofolate cyclo-ligase